MAPVSPPEEGSVAVVVRVRPPAPCEHERGAHRPVLHALDQHVLVLNPEEHGGPPGSVLPTRGPKHQGKDLKFVFDRVFGEEATQEEVFEHTTRGFLHSFLNGYNCSVFAYGATGAGKTYTMLGSEESPGIMYLTMVELYKKIEARKVEKSCEVLVSYQEVYNEQIHDLLEPKGPLAIREDPEKGVVVQGLSFHQPVSAEQLLEMLANGNKNRTQHPTDANASSSRSHAVFQIYVRQQDRAGGHAGSLRVAKMSLIDLAGSERASVANTRGQRLREGANINRSLLALINVINALADAKSRKGHVPFRDSKLTRLLKDSLGGNCRTVMIAAVSPCALAYEDTYNTLKYASRAKEIKLSLKSNVLSTECHESKCPMICEQLRAEVADLWAKLRAYEDAAQQWQNQVPAPLLPLSSSPMELPRSEEAVPKTCLALDNLSQSDKQQELEAEWPLPMELESEEEAPVEVTPSSPRADQSHQTDLQLEPKKPSCLLQGLSGSQTERLVAALLRFAQRQYCLLRDANLLTPGVTSEFEELKRLAHQEMGVSLERATSPRRPAEVSGTTPAQRTQQSCEAEVPVAVPQVPGAALAGPQELAPLAAAVPLALSPVKKRRRRAPEMSSVSQPGSPRGLSTRGKRPRRPGKGAETPRAPASPGSPCLGAAGPKPSPLPAAPSRVPLAAQNGCALPVPPAGSLNVTFVVHPAGDSPGTAASSQPELSLWDSVQNALNKQDTAKTSLPVPAVRGSSIPRPSSLPRVSGLKRKRDESTNRPSVSGPQCRSTQRPAQPSRLPEHLSGSLAGKGSKRTTKMLLAKNRGPLGSTTQPMKLLC